MCFFSAVDRSVSASLSDARDALVNAVIDSLSAYRSSVLTIQQPGLMAPISLRLFPLYVLALLKQVRTKLKCWTSFYRQILLVKKKVKKGIIRKGRLRKIMFSILLMFS